MSSALTSASASSSYHTLPKHSHLDSSSLAASSSSQSLEVNREEKAILRELITTFQLKTKELHLNKRIPFSRESWLSLLIVSARLSSIQIAFKSASQETLISLQNEIVVLDPDLGLISVINQLICQIMKVQSVKSTPLEETFTEATIELLDYKVKLQMFLRSFSELAKSSSAVLPEELQKRYVFKKPLGEGASGSVYEYTMKNDPSKTVAIKKITEIFKYELLGKRTLREIKILRMLSHPNIVRFHQLLPPAELYNFNDLSFVCEIADTNLERIISSNQNLTNEHIQYFLYQLLAGTAYMHSAGVIHRDIKPANILVNGDCSLKICDFGLSRLFRRHLPSALSSSSSCSSSSQPVQLPDAPPPLYRLTTPHVVTRWYRAPEVVLLSKKYSSAIDIWSIGCIFAELLLMQKPAPKDPQALFPGSRCYPLSPISSGYPKDRGDQLLEIFNVIGTPTKEEIQKIDHDKARKTVESLPEQKPIAFKQLFPDAEDSALDLLEKLLRFDPESRWTAVQALEHPYLKTYRDDCNTPIKFDRETYLKNHSPSEWDFEDQELSPNKIRKQLINEILYDHPELEYICEPFLSIL